LKIKLYDRNKKLVTSNYLSSSKKYFQVLNYKCTAACVYYVESSFKPGKKDYRVLVYGFKKT